MRGKAEVLFSGYSTTNSFEFRRINILEHPKTSIIFEVLDLGSGISYTVKGYPVKGMTPLSLISGSLTKSSELLVSRDDVLIYDWDFDPDFYHLSGVCNVMEELEIGVKSLSMNQTGVVTVYVARGGGYGS